MAQLSPKGALMRSGRFQKKSRIAVNAKCVWASVERIVIAAAYKSTTVRSNMQGDEAAVGMLLQST
ncbi:hypothetical protein SB861_36635 [Paraburkholderia sp. SIMBA_049]